MWRLVSYWENGLHQKLDSLVLLGIVINPPHLFCGLDLFFSLQRKQLGICSESRSALTHTYSIVSYHAGKKIRKNHGTNHRIHISKWFSMPSSPPERVCWAHNIMQTQPSTHNGHLLAMQCMWSNQKGAWRISCLQCRRHHLGIFVEALQLSKCLWHIRKWYAV